MYGCREMSERNFCHGSAAEVKIILENLYPADAFRLAARVIDLTTQL
jgi:hypothetical protein